MSTKKPTRRVLESAILALLDERCTASGEPKVGRRAVSEHVVEAITSLRGKAIEGRAMERTTRMRDPA